MMEYNDYLPRIDSGNYEYRIMLRSREKSRENFVEMRKHVMIKIEMLVCNFKIQLLAKTFCLTRKFRLDEKHVRELGLHLRSMLEALHAHHVSCTKILNEFSANNFGELDEEGEAIARRKNESFNDGDLEDDEQGQSLLISTDD